MTTTQKTKRQKEYLRWKEEWVKNASKKVLHFTFKECQNKQWCDMCSGAYASTDGQHELKIRCDCECHKEVSEK